MAYETIRVRREMNLQSRDFTSFDGVKIKIHEIGQGRPLFLLHGLFSSANVNWIKYGHADILAQAGFRVIMPDLRAHGASEAPHDSASYPDDVIVKDIEALITDYEFDEYDLAGFSLGARTSAKLVINGAKPRRLVLTGMGWEGLNGWGNRRDFFLNCVRHYHDAKRGDEYYFPVQFMKTTGIDPVAAEQLLLSFVDLDTDVLRESNIPALVVCGDKDHDNGSGQLLAENLKNARFAEISGNHMSSVTQKSLGRNIADFLSRDL